MGYIYKITNSINGKMYVGQTRRNIPIRWHEHLYYSHHKNRGYNSILHSAIRKYGDEAFAIEELEQCDNAMLMEREMFWIKELGTAKHGYNISLGGQGYNKGYDEEVLRLWNDGHTMIEMSEIIPLHAYTIAKRLKEMGVSSQDIIERGNHKANLKKETPVYQYDLEGNYIRGFSSLHEAQDSIGGRRIKLPPNNKRERQICGFQWRKFKADKIEPYVDKRFKEKKPKVLKGHTPPKPVVQFDMEGNYIQSFDSVEKASELLSAVRPQGIYSVCNGHYKSWHGYQWRYLCDAEKLGMKLSPIKRKRPKTTVYQYTMNGTYITEFPSAHNAVRVITGKRNQGTGSILANCDGVVSQAYCYRWSYNKVDFLPKLTGES